MFHILQHYDLDERCRQTLHEVMCRYHLSNLRVHYANIIHDSKLQSLKRPLTSRFSY
jgi:hypothetical protein